MRYPKPDANLIVRGTDTLYRAGGMFPSTALVPFLGTVGSIAILGTTWGTLAMLWAIIPVLIYLYLVVNYRANSISVGSFFNEDAVLGKAIKFYKKVEPGLPKQLAKDLLINVMEHAEEDPHSSYYESCRICGPRIDRLQKLIPANYQINAKADIEAVDRHLEIMKELT